LPGTKQNTGVPEKFWNVEGGCWSKKGGSARIQISSRGGSRGKKNLTVKTRHKGGGKEKRRDAPPDSLRGDMKNPGKKNRNRREQEEIRFLNIGERENSKKETRYTIKGRNRGNSQFLLSRNHHH